MADATVPGGTGADNKTEGKRTEDADAKPGAVTDEIRTRIALAKI